MGPNRMSFGGGGTFSKTSVTLTSHRGSVKKNTQEETFCTLDADKMLDSVAVISSLCENCYRDGTTRLLLTRIPHFRDVIIMAFECGECHYRSNELQPASELQDQGARFQLEFNSKCPEHARIDLNRQVVKTEYATIRIPQLDFEIPATSRRGEITTIEGVLTKAADNLEALQPQRRLVNFETAEKIQSVIDKLRLMSLGQQDFTFIVDDPSGNSYVENPSAPDFDSRASIQRYDRTAKQTEEMGYLVEQNASNASSEKGQKEQSTPDKKGQAKSKDVDRDKKEDKDQDSSSTRGSGVKLDKLTREKLDTFFDVHDRSATLSGQCPTCRSKCETRICVLDIPYFKEVVLMVTDCDACGYRDSEVKPSGATAPRGTCTTLRVESSRDLARDLLRSTSSSVTIPEVELQLATGTLGGKYTTLEGLFTNILESLNNYNSFQLGDSSPDNRKSKMAAFLTKLEKLFRFESGPFTLVLDDPLSNSFIAPLSPDNEDPQISIDLYERTEEQNDEFGLLDMKVDNYDSAASDTFSSVPGSASAAAAANDEKERADWKPTTFVPSSASSAFATSKK